MHIRLCKLPQQCGGKGNRFLDFRTFRQKTEGQKIKDFKRFYIFCPSSENLLAFVRTSFVRKSFIQKLLFLIAANGFYGVFFARLVIRWCFFASFGCWLLFFFYGLSVLAHDLIVLDVNYAGLLVLQPGYYIVFADD